MIQSDELPLAGMDRISAARHGAARLILLPVKESLQMFGSWAGPPVIRPDNGSSLPGFEACH